MFKLSSKVSSIDCKVCTPPQSHDISRVGEEILRMAACFLIISFALGISALSHRSSAFQGLVVAGDVAGCCLFSRERSAILYDNDDSVGFGHLWTQSPTAGNEIDLTGLETRKPLPFAK